MRSQRSHVLDSRARLQRNPDLVRSIAQPDLLLPAGRPLEAVRLSADALAILDGFSSPRSVAEVVPDAGEDVLAALGEWLRLGLLIRTSRSRLPSRTAPDEARLWAGTRPGIEKRVAKLSPSRRHTLRGLELMVVDGLFTPAEIRSAARCFAGATYYKSESVKGMKDYTHDAHEVLERVPFIDCITAVVARLFPGRKLELYRAYCNRVRFGDVSFEHYDSRSPSITALYFANRRWDDDWGGETMFYGVRDEATVAVAPRPGRLVVFDGRLGHRGGLPSRLCNEDRLSVAVKYWSHATRGS